MVEEELKGKNVELTLKHPKVEGGVQTYRTEDGWEMIVMLGRQEGEHYQMHRMIMSGPNLVEELITGFTKEFPEIVMPMVTRVMMGQIKEHMGKVMHDGPEMPNNKDEPPPGTKFN